MGKGRLITRALGFVGVLALFALVAIIPFVLPSLSQPQTQYLAGVMVLLAGTLAFWGTHLTRITTEKNNLREHYREVEGDLRSRFTAIASQLGAESSSIRQAGVYAMAGLANDWHRHGQETGKDTLGSSERQVCIDVLCAYLRDIVRDAEQKDLHVRQTVIDILRSSTLHHNPSRPSWIGHDFNLAGAHLCEANLTHADLSHANLSSSDLSNANLVRAILKGARLAGANLRGARLIGADLTEADLSSADFTGTRLTEINLSGAIWNDDTVWPNGFCLPHGSGQRP